MPSDAPKTEGTPTSAAEFVELSTELVEISMGRKVRVRGLCKADAVAYPHLRPIVDMALTEILGDEKALKKLRALSQLDETRAERMDSEVVVLGAIEPRFSLDGADGTVSVALLNTADRTLLIGAITRLTRGWTREQEAEVAERMRRFRDDEQLPPADAPGEASSDEAEHAATS